MRRRRFPGSPGQPQPAARAADARALSHADSYGYAVKVQTEPTRNKKMLNTQPQIRNAAYCASVGMPAQICNVRREDSPQRAACDHYLAGISFTGRPGPNWFQDVNGVLKK